MHLQPIELNMHEMASYKWVRASELMDVRNICWMDYSERLRGFLRYLNYRFGDNSPLDFVDRVLSPALDVGMG